MKKMKKAIFGIVILCFHATTGYSQTEALDRLMEYVGVDTVNPPGNEIRAAQFFAEIFDEAGIPSNSGIGAGPRQTSGLGWKVGMNRHWSSSITWMSFPLPKNTGIPTAEAEIRDGMLYGRGVYDTKSLGIAQLQAFLALYRDHVKLNRDVIFMAAARPSPKPWRDRTRCCP